MQRREVFLLLVAVMLCGTYLLQTILRPSSLVFHLRQPLPAPPPPPVLSCATHGRWVQGEMTQRQRDEQFQIFSSQLDWFKMPKSLQRKDGRCGDVNYEEARYIRALCHPRGATPCCYNFRCTSRSQQECSCPECFDLRSQIYAEYSRWELLERDCRLHQFSTEEACRLLDGHTLVFVGDSLMRHVYTAALLLLSGNLEDGALMPGISQDVRKMCRWQRMFTEKLCRLNLNHESKVCGGKVNISFYGFYTTRYGKQFLQKLRSYIGKEKTYFMVGICLHYGCKHEAIFSHYAKPALDLLARSGLTSPRVVWVGPHAPGPFKTPRAGAMGQDAGAIARFVAAMRGRLRAYGVPVLDTLNLTRGVWSHDGTHTGMGVNMLKVQILLNHVDQTESLPPLSPRLAASPQQQPWRPLFFNPTSTIPRA